MLGRVHGAADCGHIAGDAGGGLVVHHEHALDLVGLVGAQRLLDAFGVGAVPHSSSCTMTLRPCRLASSPHKWLNWPKRAIRTLLPGASVLVSADSQAPVPLDGKMMTWPSLVLKIPFSRA